MKYPRITNDEYFIELERLSRIEGQKVLDMMLNMKLIDRYEFTERFCPYDVIGYKEDRICLIEIKKRNVVSTLYPTYLLEHKKFYDMKKTKADAYFYINIFDDGFATIYRIDNVDKDENILTLDLPCPHPLIDKTVNIQTKKCFRLTIKKKYKI